MLPITINNNNKVFYMSEYQKKISKFLSYVLRHAPDSIGLTLDSQGWADITELMRLAARDGKQITLPLLRDVVASNDKQRFALDEANNRIRANQGHSVDIDLALEPLVPPDVLYHGTATRFIASIREKGLLPGSRQHVHLSALPDTAHTVGGRHGKPVVLIVRAAALHAAGHAFYRSANGVWLTDHVPAGAIEFEPHP